MELVSSVWLPAVGKFLLQTRRGGNRAWSCGQGDGKEVNCPLKEKLVRVGTGPASRMKRSWRSNQENALCICACCMLYPFSGGTDIKGLFDIIGLAFLPHLLSECFLSRFFLHTNSYVETQLENREKLSCSG